MSTKVIMITSQKGGTGKSHICLNLALNLATNASVAIVDYDPQGSLSNLDGHFVDIKIYGASVTISEIRTLPYDFLILDTPPYLFDATEGLARISDLIVIPTKASILDTIAVSKTVELLKSITPTDRLLLVLNMVKANTTLTDTMYRELKTFGVAIAKTRVSDLVDFSRSITNKGVTSSKAKYQLDALTKEILIKLI